MTQDGYLPTSFSLEEKKLDATYTFAAKNDEPKLVEKYCTRGLMRGCSLPSSVASALRERHIIFPQLLSSLQQYPQ